MTLQGKMNVGASSLEAQIAQLPPVNRAIAYRGLATLLDAMMEPPGYASSELVEYVGTLRREAEAADRAADAQKTRASERYHHP